MAMMAATRSTCIRRQIGAVIVSGNRILATGYNGSPAGARHCEEIGCLRQQLGIPSGERHEMCRASHAEMNAIAQAAASGTAIAGCTLYSTHEPCSICSKLLINAGCRRIVFMHPYPDELSAGLRAEAGIISDVFGEIDEIHRILRGAIA
jgi:dCMP deaminase